MTKLDIKNKRNKEFEFGEWFSLHNYLNTPFIIQLITHFIL